MKPPLVARWLIVLSLTVLPNLHVCAQMPGPGTAVSFDGTVGAAQAPQGVWFNGDFTVEAWVYLRSYNYWSRLIDFGNGASANNVLVALSYETSGTPVFVVYNGSTSSSIVATNRLPLNQWVHLAVTLQGTTGFIYINGVQAGNGQLSVPPNVVRTNNFIAQSNYPGDSHANAEFDEIRIWNVARSQGQIQAFMHRSLVGNETGLVAYWRMDDGNGYNLADSSGHGQTADLFDGTTWVNSSAPMAAGAGSALAFNEQLGQEAGFGSPFNYFPVTIMTWFMVPPGSGNAGLIDGDGNIFLESTGFQIEEVNGQLAAYYYRDPSDYVASSGSPMLAGAVNDGGWHHAALVVDNSGGRLYLDGVLKASQSWQGTPGPTTNNPGPVLGYGPPSFATLDEMSVWNTALGAAQIQSVMNHQLAGTEPGLAGYWRMDDDTGTGFPDLTANHNDGQLIYKYLPTWTNSGASIVVPDPGYAVDLNGSDAYVQAPISSWFFGGAFSIEGWVYLRSYNSGSRLIDCGNGAGSDNVYLALSDASGYPVLDVFTNTSGSPAVEATQKLPLNRWAFLAATFDGSVGTIYINGVAVGSGPLNSPRFVIRNNNYIGRSNFGGDGYANAIFDEVRIWGSARSQVQIQSDMNRPLLGDELGLFGYWRFDEGTGSTTLDGTGEGLNATVFNGKWTTSTVPLTHAPLLIPDAVTNITGTSATLETFVNPNGSPTSVWFAYGTNQTYGLANIISNVGSGTDVILVTNTISGLLPGTLYHFQIHSANSFGVTTGLDQTFVTAFPAIVATLPATSITASNATLKGTLNPNGADSIAWFQYGQTTNYGSVPPSMLVSGTNLTAVSVSNVITGLSPGATYHFRIAGSNVASIVFGADTIFTTAALPPAINSQGVSGIGPTSANLNAAIMADGADTTVFFKYGTTASYGSTTASTIISGTNLATVGISDLISGLVPGTAYHFQVIASNVVGTVSGGDEVFTTPAFASVTAAMQEIAGGAVAWGDFDNDGHLDMVITGYRTGVGGVTEVWHNNGDGTFSNLNAGITGVYSSSVALGDYDNDGLLDILISGTTSGGGYVTQVWRNTGHGFTNINAGVTGIASGGVAWGDFDNDGRLDILISGFTQSSGPVVQVWHNTGSGFTNMEVGLDSAIGFGANVGDFDNDGRLDILVWGYWGTQLWHNTGTGFTNVNAGLPASSWVAAVGDFDNDGLLDILALAFDSQNNPYIDVWRNTGNGFTNLNVGLPAVPSGSVAWGDYDNDGRLDIFVMGGNTYNGTGPLPTNIVTQIWRNTGSGFVKNQDLPGLTSGAAAWGDFNNDGRLDLMMTGASTNTFPYFYLMQNEMTTASNSPPAAPTGLSATLSGSTLSLRWQPASDLQTPAAGLSYNVRVGTSPGASDILAAPAGTNGTLRVAARGSVQTHQLTLQLPFTPALGQTIYWSVQSVDTSFAGSAFAPEASVVSRLLFINPAMGGGTFQAQFNILSGSNYSVWASTDLVHWIDIQDFSFGSNGTYLFTDPGATNYPRRFYRYDQH